MNLNHTRFDAEFDIEGENVFSVERKKEETCWGRVVEPAQTIIGLYRKDNNEWDCYYLPCSEAKHNQLVDRFRKKLKLPPYGNTGV